MMYDVYAFCVVGGKRASSLVCGCVVSFSRERNEIQDAMLWYEESVYGPNA
jgi:hypothetical protein